MPDIFSPHTGYYIELPPLPIDVQAKMLTVLGWACPEESRRDLRSMLGLDVLTDGTDRYVLEGAAS